MSSFISRKSKSGVYSISGAGSLPHAQRRSISSIRNRETFFMVFHSLEYEITGARLNSILLYIKL